MGGCEVWGGGVHGWTSELMLLPTDRCRLPILRLLYFLKSGLIINIIIVEVTTKGSTEFTSDATTELTTGMMPQLIALEY